WFRWASPKTPLQRAGQLRAVVATDIPSVYARLSVALLNSGKMRALYLILPILGILAIAYRYYSAFIAARLMVLDDNRVTPAHQLNDGRNYHPTHRLVLFGHHFAAIAGAGPLIGPVLAAHFGSAPGLIWLVAGVCLAGAVHDYVILWA